MAKDILYDRLEFSHISVNARTIFNPIAEGKGGYYDISRLSGKVVRVWYDWDIGGEVLSSWRNLSIPQGLDEAAVMNYMKAMLEQ